MQVRDTDTPDQFPEGRPVSPYKSAVKDRMCKETGLCCIFKLFRIDSPVELHYTAKGGVTHDPDGISKKVK